MPNAAGKAPAGAASAGYGVPDAGYAPNSALLPNLRTGLPMTGRYINPTTGDYQFTADGRLMGMDTVPQLVMLALLTVRGSSVIPTLGNTFTQVQEKGPSFLRQMQSVLNSALDYLVKRKLLQINSITTVETPSNPDAGVVQLLWTDLTTSIAYSNTVGR